MKDGKNKSKKSKKFGLTLFWALPFFSGAFVGGYIFGKVIGNVGETNSNLFLVLLFIAAVVEISTFLHIIVHETGHLIFGLATGYRFLSFRISGIMLAKIEGKFCLKRHKVTGTGGQCLMAPPDMNNGKVPFVLFNLGGVLFDTIVTLICVIVLLVLKPESVFVKAGIELFIFFGILLGFLNGIPIKNDFITNDGSNIMLFKKDEKALRSFWCQLKIYEEISKGKRLKDMPKDWFTIPEGEELKDGMSCAMGVFACNRLLDEKNFDAASELIDKLIDDDAGTIGIHRNELVCDKIFCELIGGNNPEVIKKLLDKSQKKFMKSMKDTPSVIRTNYALALLYEKDKIKAEKIRNQFEKREKSYAYSADMQSERELIDIAKQQS